jgi:uncharacterized protein
MLRVACLAVLVLLVAPGLATAQEAVSPTQGISVVGEARSFADNDVGIFRFGVTVRRPTAARALRSASATVGRIVGAVRAAGVAREDVQTDVVVVERAPARRSSSRRGWIARNVVRVTVRQLASAGTVVDRAVGAGATSVDGPELGVADPALVYRQTLALAFADARAKAEALAVQAGVRLGPPTVIREEGADLVEERDEVAASPDSSAGGGETRVEPGRSQVTARVLVTFAVLPPA